MNEVSLIQDLFFVLCAGFIGGILAKIFKLPLVIGYLGSGIVIGRLSAFFFPRASSLTGIAQIGVALLLFTLGLEFTLHKLKEFGEVIVFGAFIQVILTTLFATIVFPFFGFDFYSSLVLGAAFSLSSTAVVIKTFSDRGELETLPAEMTSGWLFMQDMYTVPILMIIPVVGHLIVGGHPLDPSSLFTLCQTILNAGILFWLILILGRKIVPFIMEKIAEQKSRELVTIAAVMFCFLFALIFQRIGFSYAVGAFVAGILIASSSARLGIFSEVRPLRNLFSVVFFVTLGFLLDPVFIIQKWFVVICIMLFMMCIKFIISILIILFLGYHTKIAILVSSSLLTVGEFAFIFATTLQSQNLITPDVYAMLISVTLISLFVGALPLSAGTKLYYGIKHFCTMFIPWTARYFQRFSISQTHPHDLTDHIIVLGYGRVGKYISRALSFVQVPYIVVDFDHRIIKKIREEGVDGVYGDPSDSKILEIAGIKRAKAVIIAYADRMMQETVVTTIFNLNKDIRLLIRTHFEEDQKKLKALGAHVIVQPEFEASIVLTEKILRICKIPQDEIEGKITRLKIEHGVG
jgi:monovalent cation:H+ antiporter-2, CPA2 family